MMGAEIVLFSPLQDTALPECDGVFLGGGYPELYAKQLSENTSLLTDLREKLVTGLPCYAECGGFMYLMEGYRDNDTLYPWAGAVQGTCWMTDRLVRFGYVNMTANTDNVLCKAGDSIHAHEFHYSDSDQNGADGAKGWKSGFLACSPGKRNAVRRVSPSASVGQYRVCGKFCKSLHPLSAEAR